MNDPAFKIEKGVPIPPAGQRTQRNKGYRRLPFGQMEVGDSFLSPTDDPMREARNLLDGARPYGIKITTRRENGGIRAWRIA